MRWNVGKKKAVTSLWLALSLATSISYADGFYTIIGPDGHPIIVQKPEAKQKVESKPKTEKKQSSEVVTDTVVPTQTVIQTNSKASNEAKKAEINSVDKPVSSSVSAPNESKVIQQNLGEQKAKKIEKQAQATAQHAISNKPLVESQPAINRVSESQKLVAPTPTVVSKDINKQVAEQQKTNKVVPSDDKNFAVIDGEKYVNNEYLEDREFNLEGKKRFYMTPEVGAVHGRYETIERQKGLSASLLERIRSKSEPDERKAVVLAATYFRLPKDEVVQNLEQSCFTGKKMVKAKNLSIKNQELGIWPVAPIKEHFAYEVIKLDPQVQNVLLTSYASSSKIQTYYWPLVVFLDQQGCVIEGVSGFKNEESQDNNTQFAAMEGILRKPEKAMYMFLTPLSSAVDVENKQLTNHGQIKLSVIQ